MAWWQLWKPSWKRNWDPDADKVDLDADLDTAGLDDVYEAYGGGRPHGTVKTTNLQAPEWQLVPIEAPASPPPPEPMPQWIIDLCIQAMKEVEIEENFIGSFSDEERKRKQWAVCTRLLEERRLREARADAFEYESDAQSELLDKLTEITNELNRIAAASENTPTNLALRFQREHPFLAGWIGADLAIRSSKK